MVESRRSLMVISVVAAGLTASSIAAMDVLKDDVGGPLAVAAATLLVVEGVIVLLRGALRSTGRRYGIRVRVTAPSVVLYASSTVFVSVVYWVIARASLKSDIQLGDTTLSVDFPLMAVVAPMTQFAAVLCTAWLGILGLTQSLPARANGATTTPP